MSESHDSIEFAEPKHSKCECCGGTTTSLTRFVTRHEAAFAVYFARYSENHTGEYVSVLAGFGDWSEGAAPQNRIAIGFRIWAVETGYQVALIDAEDDWDSDFLGVKLTRDEALKSNLRQEVFDLSDHMVECDQPIIDYLNRK